MAAVKTKQTNESDHAFIEAIKNVTNAMLQKEAAEDFPFRSHFGASIIGHPCERYLFYTFRWVKIPKFEGRILRIFDRGHKEEEKMIQLLRDCGLCVATNLVELLTYCNLPLDVSSIDTLRDMYGMDLHKPSILTTDEQIKINMEAHIGGSLDAVLLVPAEFSNELGYFIPVECKTHNAANFSATFRKDLSETQAKHYSQANMYATFLNAKYFLYMGENKNDDEINYKLIEANHTITFLAVQRAKKIIATQHIGTLAKVAHDQAWRCKMCDFKMECAKKVKATSRNCRSCINFAPASDGTWHCMQRDIIVGKHKEIEVAESCELYENIIK